LQLSGEEDEFDGNLGGELGAAYAKEDEDK